MEAEHNKIVVEEGRHSTRGASSAYRWRACPGSINLTEKLVKEIDRIRESIGVDREALIKVWLHERVQQEKAAATNSS